MALALLRRRLACRGRIVAGPIGRDHATAAGRAEDGFGLVESLMALGVAATGLLAVAGLMAAGATLQRRSRDGGQTGQAAVQQMERLRILPLNDARVQIGGSLTGNQLNYTALVNVPPAGQVRVRWQVQAGPANSRAITVRAIPAVRGARISEVRNIVWRPDTVPLP